jgi:hypothetical protein
MIRRRLPLIVAAVTGLAAAIVLVSTLRAEAPKPASAAPAGDGAEIGVLEAERWKLFTDILGRPGTLNDHVYTITVPRDDLDVSIEGGPVPVEAGLASTFHFYLCDCGKVNVVGQFTVLDFEANDVIDELREGMIKVVAVSPMFLGDRPRITSVRFQGEGGGRQLTSTLKAALEWTGEARNAPSTRPVGKPADSER